MCDDENNVNIWSCVQTSEDDWVWTHSMCPDDMRCVEYALGLGICQFQALPESKIMVQRLSSSTMLIYGAENTMISFNLINYPVDQENNGETALVTSVTISVLMSSEEYNRLLNCSLRSLSSWQMLDFTDIIELRNRDDGSSFAVINFSLTNGYMVPAGVSSPLTVQCFIAPSSQIYEPEAVQSGFIPSLGTSPGTAIVVYGRESGERLLVEPDQDVFNTLTN